VPETELWKPPELVPLKRRLTTWFVIYFGLQLPLILWWPCVLNFPWGLAPYFAFLTGSSNEALCRPLGYLFYIVHFVLSVALPWKKAFTVLMLILIVVVSLNTVSCMRTLGPNLYKGIPKIEGRLKGVPSFPSYTWERVC
jgi:hypothetical protein